MSEVKTVHMVRIPDCTLAIFVTMEEGDCEISFEDFFSPEKEDSQDHDAIKVLGKSIMEVVDICIETTLSEMSHGSYGGPSVERQEGNVVYLKTPLSEENDDA
jgi:hypothetical protein